MWQDESLPANESLEADVENAILESDHAIFLISKLWLSRRLSAFELGRFDRANRPQARLIPVFRLPKEQLKLPPQLVRLKGVTWLETDPDPDARFWEVYCGITDTAPGPQDAWGDRGRGLMKASVPPPARTVDRAAVAAAAPAQPRGGACLSVIEDNTLRVTQEDSSTVSRQPFQPLGCSWMWTISSRARTLLKRSRQRYPAAE